MVVVNVVVVASLPVAVAVSVDGQTNDCERRKRDEGVWGVRKEGRAVFYYVAGSGCVRMGGLLRGRRPVVRWLLSGGLYVLGGWSLGVCLGEGGRGGAC